MRRHGLIKLLPLSVQFDWSLDVMTVSSMATMTSTLVANLTLMLGSQKIRLLGALPIVG